LSTINYQLTGIPLPSQHAPDTFHFSISCIRWLLCSDGPPPDEFYPDCGDDAIGSIPFTAMFVSNLVLNNTIYAAYYDGFTVLGNWGIYVTLAVVACLPFVLKATKGSSLIKLSGVGIGGALIFFLVSNLGDWMSSGMYPQNAAGLLACYTAGLPFFLNTLLSTLLFGGVGVAIMKIIDVQFGKLQPVKA